MPHHSLQRAPRKPQALNAHLALLPPELLRLIALYLKPRHLYKVMLASKRLLQTVDCGFYWERAAAHAVLRHVYDMEIDPGAGQICRFPARQGPFNMVNANDYRESVDCLIGRARQVFGDHLTVAQLVLAGEAIILVDPDNYRHIHAAFAESAFAEGAFAESAETMKEMVKRETRRVLAEQTSVGRKLRKFQRELEDDAELSRAAKRRLMGMLGALLTDVAEDEMVETELYKFAHMALDFV